MKWISCVRWLPCLHRFLTTGRDVSSLLWITRCVQLWPHWCLWGNAQVLPGKMAPASHSSKYPRTNDPWTLTGASTTLKGTELCQDTAPPVDSSMCPGTIYIPMLNTYGKVRKHQVNMFAWWSSSHFLIHPCLTYEGGSHQRWIRCNWSIKMSCLLQPHLT